MAKGQVVPTTVHNLAATKISDGKSVRVAVPENTEIKASSFYLLGGFFGVAMQSVKTGAGETAEVILSIEQAEYETDQVSELDDLGAGTALYWNETAKEFTEAADDGQAEPTAYRPVGRITVGRGANDVIWFILGPQV